MCIRQTRNFFQTGSMLPEVAEEDTGLKITFAFAHVEDSDYLSPRKEVAPVSPVSITYLGNV